MSKRVKKSKRTPPDPLPMPDQAELQAIKAARDRLQQRNRRLTTLIETGKSGDLVEIGPEHADRAGWLARLEDVFGTSGRNFALSQLNHILAAARKSEGGYDAVKVNALIAAIEGAKPQNELQAMLAVQMVMAHDLTIQAMRRATKVDQIPQYDSSGSMAVKLMRAFAGHLELLEKLQRGGEQTVRVEHVHVHAGGQAIVGTVSAGGGAIDEINNQPHAKGELPAASAQGMSEVLRADAEGDVMPFAGCQR